MLNPQEMIKTSMFLQLMNTASGPYGPIMNLITLNLYERIVATFPIWSNWMRRKCPCIREKIRGDSKPITRDPSAIIDCERGVAQPSKNGTLPAFITRMDAIIHYVASSLNIKKLLAISNHDYLPNEFEAVRIDEDIYFKMTHIEPAEDGSIKNLKFQIFCYDGTIQTLQKFVDSCSQDYERKMTNKLGNNLYFFDQVVDSKKKRNQNPLPKDFLVYTKHIFSTTRTFENVYFEDQSIVKKRVNFFLNNRTWYEKKGIPYTLGFLFHGDPGTGKTSEIKAIANVARRHPVNIQLSEIKTKSQLRHLFFSDELHVWNGNTLEKYTIPVNERLYIIEDADAMGDVLLRREWKKPVAEKPKDPFDIEVEDTLKEPIDLSFLLNLLDGTLESSGRIMVITSNFPERFDKALIRPGRIDMIIEFKKCTLNVLREMIRGFYDRDNLDHELWNHPEIDYKWTPAEVQQVLFRNFDNPMGAMKELLESQPQRLEQTEMKLVSEDLPGQTGQLSIQASLPMLETLSNL
jgi:ATPase family associated with various cellular activities (AAA)